MSTVCDLFAAQVKRAPDAVAVVQGDRRYTYLELDAASEALAVSLRRRRVGIEDRVAVLYDRSFDQVVAMFGVLKAGAAMVALDVVYPVEQWRGILADAQATVVLTDRELDPPALGLSAEAILRWTEDDGRDAAGPDHAPPTLATANLAYVAYSSGSTGRPKGIDVSHASMANYVDWTARQFRVGPGDRVLHHASIGFDVGLWEILLPLTCGAAVVLAAAGGQVDSEYLVREVAVRRVSVLRTTPSQLRRIVREPRLKYCSRLRIVLSSSDTLPTHVMNEALDRLGPRCTLYHTFGVTEVSVESSAWACRPLGPHEKPRIGTPISNTEIHLLDEQLRPVPDGATGEIYIGGVALARGYRGRPGATAAAFVPNPFAAAGARMYRTRDLAVRTGDDIVLIGRLDRQIKVRGHRIDPEEIEATFQASPLVDVAVVQRREDGELLGYLVPAAGAELELADLVALARRRLPPQAVPAAYYRVDDLPVTVNGKVDRVALLRGDYPRLQAASATVEPRSPEEDRLCRVFASAMGLSAVEPDSDFFELGGHSMLAMTIVEALAREHGLRLPILGIFEHRSVRAIIRAGIMSAAATPVDRTVPREGGRPLSPDQLGIWLAQLANPTRARFNAAFLVHLQGELDVDRLALALRSLLARQESLRTRFVNTPDGPRQVVDPVGEDEDVLVVAAVGGERDEDDVVDGELHRPFDLAREWPVRFRLLQRPDGSWRLLVVQHHVASDGESSVPLLRDLQDLYQSGQMPAQARSPGYLDLVAGSAEPDDEATAAAVRWWRDHLAGLQPVELPTDRPRSPVRSGRGAFVEIMLPAARYARVLALARDVGSTPFAVLHSIVTILLARLTGQTELATVVPASVRPAGAGDLIGNFTRAMIIRTDLSGVVSLVQAVATTMRAITESFRHISADLTTIGARDRNLEALQRVIVSMEAEPVAPSLAGVASTIIDVITKDVDYDLQFTFVELAEGRGLRVILHYDADLFSPRSIHRLGRYLTTAADYLLGEPSGDVQDLPMLGASDVRLLERVNATARLVPAGCVMSRLGEVAAEVPDAPAIAAEAGTHTYAELVHRCRRVAAGLRRAGVRRGDAVAILAERNLDTIVAMLAVFQCGGVYVPLRATDSVERRQTLCSLAQPRLVVDCSVADPSGPAVGGPVGAPVVSVDDLTGAPGDAAAHPCCRGEDAAYLLFTSGTTGAPKGVQVGHQALINRLLWAVDQFALRPADRHLQKAALDFDVSIAEILQPLMSGGCLVLPEASVERDADRLAAAMAELRVSIIHFVPSALKAFLDSGATLPPCVRHVACSGEALPSTLARDVLARHPWIELRNTYGPTETTIECSHHPVRAGGTGGYVPIGRPIWNVQLEVLDRSLRRQPPMVRGELFVRGAALATGYLGQPGPTAARFRPDPYTNQPGARMYATGDLCYRDGAGDLHFVERVDRQVKVRGFRIELGGVELAVTSHPDVLDCAAAVETTDGIGHTLVAYVSLADGARLDIAELTLHLLQRLPRHAIPDRFVELDQIPRTTAGKLDRASAAARTPAAGTRPSSAASDDALATAVGRVWASVLGVDAVAGEDDFFALGGHSLRAAQCIARLRDELGMTVPMVSFFQHPTLTSFTTWLRTAAGTVQADRLPRIVGRAPGTGGDAGGAGRLPLSRAQQRLWVIEQSADGGADYDLSTGWLFAPTVDPDRLAAAVGAVVDRHAILRTTYHHDHGVPFQQVEDDLAPVLHRADAPDRPAPEHTAHLLGLALSTPLDLSSGPIMSVAIGRCVDGVVAVMNVHHIAMDGWSLPLFENDLLVAYEKGGFTAAATPQYADFVAWEREVFPAESLQDGLAYWVDALAGAEPLRLPDGGPTRPEDGPRGGYVRAEFDEEFAVALEASALRADATVFMMLLSSFALALHCLTHQRDLVIGTDAANRLVPEMEGMIGFFVNELPLRIRVDDDSTLAELLGQTRDVVLAGLGRQHVPFDLIVEAINPPRRAGRVPLIPAKLVLQSPAAAGRPAPPLSVLDEAESPGSAKSDLLFTWERRSKGMVGLMEYATATMNDATARWLTDVFAVLVREVAHNDGTTVAAARAKVDELSRQRARTSRVLRRPAPAELSPQGGDT